MERTASMRTLAPIPDELPDSQAEILRRLGGDVMSVDALGAAVGIGGDPLLVAISRLELAGWLTQAPGGLLRRVR
jgi:predicted Rossmann fold nucleotide-binding protein DprA/Smf involved in DNA uptake